MKQVLFSMAVLLLGWHMAQAQSTDEQAIQTTIESESKAYHTNADRKAFAGYWVYNEDTRLVYNNAEGKTQCLKGADLKKSVENGLLPPPDNAKIEMTDFVIKADGNIGWASFQQKSTYPDGKVSTLYEFRCMQKVDGVWKIVSSSIHEYKAE